jgi:hypothetical protein
MGADSKRRCSMNLTDLQRALAVRDVPSDFSSDGALIARFECSVGEGPMRMFPIYFRTVGKTRMTAEMRLRRIAAERIEHVETFCWLINDRWGTTCLEFDELNRRFLLSVSLSAQGFDGEELVALISVHHLVAPICAAVGRTGKWVDELPDYIKAAEIPSSEYIS